MASGSLPLVWVSSSVLGGLVRLRVQSRVEGFRACGSGFAL